MNGLNPATVEAVRSAVEHVAEETLADDHGDDNDDVDDDYDNHNTPTTTINGIPRQPGRRLDGGMWRTARQTRATTAEGDQNGDWEELPRSRRPHAAARHGWLEEGERGRRGGEKKPVKREVRSFEGERAGGAGWREKRVGAFKPAAGKVELEVFGRRVASFGQVSRYVSSCF